MNLAGTELLIAFLVVIILALGILLAGRKPKRIEQSKSDVEPGPRCYGCGGKQMLKPMNAEDFLCDYCAAQILYALERDFNEQRQH